MISVAPSKSAGRGEVVLISGYTPVAIDRHGIGAGDFRLLQKPVADLAASSRADRTTAKGPG